MSVSVSFGGVTYAIPEDGESGWESLTAYLVALSSASISTTSKQAIRTTTSTSVTVSAAADYAVVVNASSAASVTLPVASTGQVFVIVDGSGAASTNAITIAGSSGATIAGAANYVLRSNRGAVAVIFDGSNWNLVGEATLCFRSTIRVEQSATNTGFVQAGLHQSVAAVSAADGTSCSAVFGGSGAIEILVSTGAGAAMHLSSSYLSAIINAISDPGSIFLRSDAGTGIYVSKSAGSGTVTFKNRLGGASAIEIKALSNILTSIAAWS